MEVDLYESAQIVSWFTAFYAIWLVMVFKLTPEPMMLNSKGKWVQMQKPDYYLQYLEWVSFVHAWIAIALSGYWIYYLQPNYNGFTTRPEFYAMNNSLAYLIYDTIVEVYYGTYDKGIIFHHVVAINTFLMVIRQEYAGSITVLGLLYSEVSNPVYQVRNAMKRMNLESWYSYQIILWIYAAIFIFFRGVMFPLALPTVFYAYRVPFYLKLSFVPGFFVSQGWIVLIISMLWKSVPHWWSDPEKIKQTPWYIRGRKFFAKYTKDAPWAYVVAGFIILYSSVLPVCYLYYVTYVNPDMEIMRQSGLLPE